MFVDEYNADEYYQTEEDMLFLLKHIPIIPNFGEEKLDFSNFERYVKDNMTKKGIKTNSHRGLIIATK